jgi:hypothetical protein
MSSFSVKVHNNNRGKAFSQLFEYIKKNYPDREFERVNMPEVSTEFLNEILAQTAETNWITATPKSYAKEALLIDMCQQGLLKTREMARNDYGDKDIFFSLTDKGKQVEIIFDKPQSRQIPFPNTQEIKKQPVLTKNISKPSKIKIYFNWIRLLISIIFLIGTFGAYFSNDSRANKMTLNTFIVTIVIFSFIIFISIRKIRKLKIEKGRIT